jgi:uncharacterized protein YegJ (DUF2314 family)
MSSSLQPFYREDIIILMTMNNQPNQVENVQPALYSHSTGEAI